MQIFYCTYVSTLIPQDVQWSNVFKWIHLLQSTHYFFLTQVLLFKSHSVYDSAELNSPSKSS